MYKSASSRCMFVGVLAAALISSSGVAVAATTKQAAVHQLSACARAASLTGTTLGDTSGIVTNVIMRGAGPVTVRGFPGELNRTFNVPAHCEVFGKLQQRTGENGQVYAIQFHMRLPINWNGRFFFQGGGGSNGNIGDALGNLQGRQPKVALALGYAVVSQDSGHSNDTNNDPKLQGVVTFGWDFQARRDYAYSSHEVVTRVAKNIIKAMYGAAPVYSYFVGCSKGGQEGMMMAQRYPEYFNGILAVAPGFTLPKASAIGEAWDSQALGTVSRNAGALSKSGVPLLNKSFSDQDLAIAAKAIVDSCDDLDGVKDGMISNFKMCTAEKVAPALSAATCKGGKASTCLSGDQVDALKKIIGGAHNSKGEPLYSDWAWDSGFGGKSADGKYYQGWRSWKTGPYDSDTNTAINATLGAAAASAIFTTPATAVPMDGDALTNYALQFDFDKDAPRIFATEGKIQESAWDTMSASSLDRTQFQQHGGKLLIVQGVSDPIFSINDTIRWLEALNVVQDGKADRFVRLFPVPGMNHCGGGPSTDNFDAFSSLVDWTEHHNAPDKILAKAGPQSPWPGRTRPLCSYPAVARYNGQGSIEDASNFVCK